MRTERRGTDAGATDGDESRTGNGHNDVIARNCTDHRLRVRASIQINTIPGRVVAPVNAAYAEGSCLECQTLAIALQIDLYNGDRANDVHFFNNAVATSTSCTRCASVARAAQYIQAVNDPLDVSTGIATTIDDVERELRSIQQDPSVTLAQAEARVDAILARFNTFGGSLQQVRDEHID